MKFDLVASDRVSWRTVGGQSPQALRMRAVPCSTLEIGRVVLVGQVHVAEITNVTVDRHVLHMQILTEQRLLLVLGVQRIRIQQPVNRELVSQIRFSLFVPVDRVATEETRRLSDREKEEGLKLNVQRKLEES